MLRHAITNYDAKCGCAMIQAEVTFNLVAAVTESKDYTDAQLASYSDTAAMNQAIADALASAALSNGQNWTGGPTFNLLKGTTVLRNLSVAGALMATFQNLDDTILIESDSYARSETYTQLETGAAITAALDALNLSQYRTEAQVLALIAGELVPDWGLELRGGRADQLRNEAEVDQNIADAVTGGMDLSPYFTSAETQSYVAHELLSYYPAAEADSRFLRTNDLGPFDARYFVTTPGAEGGGIFNLAQTQFTPNIIRNLLCQTPLSAQPILGNGSTLQISCDCWSKGQSDTRYPLIANFNSLGQRVTDLENSPGVDPTADLTVNSLTATSFVETPQLQSAAGDLQIQNALVTVCRPPSRTAAFSLDRDVVSNLRVEAPLVRCDPAASVLTIQGGSNGVLVDDTLLVNGALAPEASLPFLTLSGGSRGVLLSLLLEQIAVGGSGETVGMVIRNASPTGTASLLLDSNNQNGVAELVVLSGGGVQINSFQQFISFNNTSGLANMAIEPNIGAENVRAIPEEELQETFDAVELQLFDRIDGAKEQIGFVAQDVQASGKLDATMCKTRS
eukprot:s11367_g1.t1